MENLYRLNEYSGKLPNPKSFPIAGGIFCGIQDRPYTFSDGFILEMTVSEKDKKKLGKKVVRVIPVSNLGAIIGDTENSKILLSEPEYIYDFSFPAYILFTPSNKPVGIQVKYYRYFRNRYPKCQFYSKGDSFGIIGVKLDGKLVGACMPIVLDIITINKIKEERK